MTLFPGVGIWDRTATRISSSETSAVTLDAAILALASAEVIEIYSNDVTRQ